MEIHETARGPLCPVVRRLIPFAAALLAGAILCFSSAAQSLDPKNPAPLKEGVNSGTVDNFGGPNYFYFFSGPGKTTINATYKSMGVLGNPMRSTLTVELYPENKAWVSRMTITSLKESSQQHLVGSLTKETKLILAIIPPSGGLVRSGGDYEVTASGAVRFDKPLNDTDLIVGTYTPMIIYENEDSAVKFKRDGTLEFASGTLGTWKLFDEDTHIYTVTFLSNRLSLKLMPGRGLVEARDPTSVVFKRNK